METRDKKIVNAHDHFIRTAMADERVARDFFKQAFFELINVKISPEVGDKVMTLGEQLRAEGWAEGKAEGIEKRNLEIAEKLLAEKVELAFIQKITGLSLTKLEEIQKSIKS